MYLEVFLILAKLKNIISYIEVMKKNKSELLILLIISIGLSILLPNFFKQELTIFMPSKVDLVIWTIAIFTIISIVYFSAKPKDMKTVLRIPNGFHELYNENNQITKKGYFEGGKLYNGSINVYKKDGNLSHIEKIKEGILIENNILDN